MWGMIMVTKTFSLLCICTTTQCCPPSPTAFTVREKNMQYYGVNGAFNPNLSPSHLVCAVSCVCLCLLRSILAYVLEGRQAGRYTAVALLAWRMLFRVRISTRNSLKQPVLMVHLKQTFTAGFSGRVVW